MALKVHCLKFVSVIFNIVFWISGLAILAVGIATKALKLYVYLRITQISSGSLPSILIGIGFLILLIGSLGCYCIVREKRNLLYLFSLFLIIVFIIQFSAAVLAFAYIEKIEASFVSGLHTALNDSATDSDKKNAMDDIQKYLRCCGVDSYKDWKDANITVPDSCCSSCGVSGYFNDIGSCCPESNYYKQGCASLVTQFLKDHFDMMGGVAVAFATLQLFGAFLLCFLARALTPVSQYEDFSGPEK